MKYSLCLLAAALCCSITFAQSSQMESIFNGEDLSGWQAPEDNQWFSAADGVLSVTSGPKKSGQILWTEKEYGDFALEFEFKMGEGTVDSGIFLRNNRDQIQIGISGSLKRDMTASPYIPGKGYPVEAQGVKELLKPKDWNTMRIEVRGDHYTSWLNGKKVMTYTSASSSDTGKIGIQLHAGKKMSIQYRKMMAAAL